MLCIRTLSSICFWCLLLIACSLIFFFFFFNDTATTEIYTLSLHDALPICGMHPRRVRRRPRYGHDASEPSLATAHRAERVHNAQAGVERDVAHAGGIELVAEWIGRLDAQRRGDAKLDDGGVVCAESDRAHLDWLRHGRDCDGGGVPLDRRL